MKVLLFALGIFCIMSNAIVPREFESSFTQAHLAFQKGQWEESLETINQILLVSPQQTESLELKALVLKQIGQSDSAQKIYQYLYSQASQMANFSKKGLYAFELGNLASSSDQPQKAKKYYEEAIASDTNPEASHFSLGKLEWEQKNWKACREHFEKASDSDAFKTSSQYFIAASFLKESRTSDAIGAFIEAKESAENDLTRSKGTTQNLKLLAQEVLNTSAQELRAFDQSTALLEVGTGTGFDSNVLFMPNTSDAANTASPSSLKQSLFWRVRYSTSPVSDWHYLGSYQGNFNYHFNSETSGGQFFTHDINQFVTRGTLRKRQIGLKIGATGVMQYREEAYRPFSLNASVGPFFKSRIQDNWWLGLETFSQPNRNFLDSTVSASARRSGWEQVIRAYFSSAEMNPYWSPSILLSRTFMWLEGNEFSGSRWNLDLTNSMYLSSSLFLAQTLSLNLASFPNRDSGARSDHGALMGVSAGYQVTEKILTTAQLEYGRNVSSDSNFTYNRWNSTLSAHYRF